VQVELLAWLAELLSESNRMFIAANTEKGTELPPYLHIPRPHELREGPKQKEPPKMSPKEDQIAFFRGG
jgi:hypothetical protein